MNADERGSSPSPPPKWGRGSFARGSGSYGEELASIIGRKVDFCSRLHPLILGRVKDELLPVYEHA
ncbi:MAG TPA: hypothetical protein VG077_17730 [Verrucomicrobiae bacterium]|nr:hypothetical protein [Verrucomicrobiae bacterium]